ncbi:tyrosine-type recombinase/integrase [Alteromonas sp. ASW11-130]|uniref:tyrosine-type recombinase/integrase n=1 Tax=Alteromonas sp. ASW11-130 TaxID=3015775 RepID=UPI0022423A99|nr:tyrosine-type recombinase/integrase [Alteromonas sp. ASW11-130]MCW8093398.1 tyrosine-type recombinase/integrase [Alteromonas sp. ASW11-130]
MNMTEEQIINRLTTDSEHKMFAVASNLYLKPKGNGKANWVLRAQVNGKRLERVIGAFSINAETQQSKQHLTLNDAVQKLDGVRSECQKGFHPVLAVVNNEKRNIKTVDELFARFTESKAYSQSTQQMHDRVYHRDVSPRIGRFATQQITLREIEDVLAAIRKDDKPTVTQAALRIMKGMFGYAAAHKIVEYNVCENLTMKDAGHAIADAGMALADYEIERFFSVLNSYPEIVNEVHKISYVLLLTLGLRKMELFAATWDQVDWNAQVFNLAKVDVKTSQPVAVPIPVSVMPLFERLHLLANGSDYLFPAAPHKPIDKHLSASASNYVLRMILTSDKSPMKHVAIPYFTIHDLRRTFRTMLTGLDVEFDVAEACLNHKLNAKARRYDRHNRFAARKRAHAMVADIIVPMAFPDGITAINELQLAA